MCVLTGCARPIRYGRPRDSPRSDNTHARSGNGKRCVSLADRRKRASVTPADPVIINTRAHSSVTRRHQCVHYRVVKYVWRVPVSRVPVVRQNRRNKTIQNTTYQRYRSSTRAVQFLTVTHASGYFSERYNRTGFGDGKRVIFFSR